jgi:hypothetical protein
MEEEEMKGLLLAMGIGLFTAAGCQTTDEEKLRSNYEQTVQRRLKQMDNNLQVLEDRKGVLLGEPQEQLRSTLANVKRERNTVAAEFNELRRRNEGTWLEKKRQVDQRLAEMDRAYNDALSILNM